MKLPNRKSPNHSPHFPGKPTTFLLLLLSMASLLSLLFSSRLTPSPSAPIPIPIQIQRACTATRYPDTCQAQLAQSPHSPPQIISRALSVSAQYLNTAQSMLSDILAASSHNHNRRRADAAQTCVELLTNSARRTHAAADALSRGSLKHARAWLSAVLVYQYDCWSALNNTSGSRSGVHKTMMSFLNDSLIVSTSNALSMMAALLHFGADTASWAPLRTERSGFWETGTGGSGLGFVGRFPEGLAADATVCKVGCDYGTVQGAVDAAPTGLEGGKRHVIRIKQGVYVERVRVWFEKRNLVFVGDGMGKTLITASFNTALMGIPTYDTATVGVLGDGFMASGITFQNTAGAGAHQAVAFRSDSDLSFIHNCEFLGNQDTLYPHSLRQLYKSCRIEGNVDFIFGGAAAFFHNCTILVRPRQKNPAKGEKNAITAQGRTDPAQSTGFVFFGCLLNGTDEYMKLYFSKPGAHRNYLGRPWKEYSRTVFVDSVIEALVVPAGWLPWKGDFALTTLYYGEYGNTGPGAELSQRVPWSSQIPGEDVSMYSASNFIQADEYSITVAETSSSKKRMQ